MRTIHKILITGGHVTPALAVMDEIRKRHPEVEMVFVGRKYNNDREQTVSFEYTEVTKRNIRFHHLSAGRFTRIASLQSLQNLFRIPAGFVSAFQILRTEKPDVILSFGGYLALPIAIMASFRKIRIVTHEQTIHPGLANKLIAYVADTIFIAFPESKAHFSDSKTILTGNPIRPDLLSATPLDLSPDIPVLYVTGGSLGAHALNVHIEHILSNLVQSYRVIHQTGNVEEYHDFERLKRVRETLPLEYRDRYAVVTHLGSQDVGRVFARADLIISRAGANTFFELIAFKKPAILVPLPWSAHDEQRKHAQILEQRRVARVFDQDKASTELLKMIREMIPNLETYIAPYDELTQTYITNATDRIITHIFPEDRAKIS